MTKDVLLSISGLHQDVTGIEAQGDDLDLLVIQDPYFILDGDRKSVV